MTINWLSCLVSEDHAAETFPCVRQKGRFEASLWREGVSEGGRGVIGGLGVGWGGVVVDCFSYKSGIADTSPYQTTGHSGLSVSITEAKEGGG